MLPVTAGEAATRRHITAYAVTLLLASLAIGWQAGLGYPYFAAAALLGGRFVQLALALQRTPTEPAAWAVFGYSNAYLFLLFGAIIADIGWVGLCITPIAISLKDFIPGSNRAARLFWN